MEWYRLTVHELLERLNNKETTAGEILLSLAGRIRDVDQRVKAYVRTERAGGAPPGVSPAAQGPLQGLPVTLKDNICTEGLLTECCSMILRGFVPPYDATVVSKLKDAGALVLAAKANMDEFAFGSSTEHSCFGPTRNPWDLARVPGGSSGGCAAAVAADEALWALGSDTGGSIRQPASFCGVVGLKPTYGRVSRYGLIAFASSLDQIGPITKDVHDCALLLNVISGHDDCDATSAPAAVPDYTRALVNDCKGMRIGIPKEYFVEGIDREVRDVVREAIERLKALGAQVIELSLPHTEFAVPVYYIVATAEASSNLARYDGVQYGFRSHGTPLDGARGKDGRGQNLIEMYARTRQEAFGEEARRRVLLGTFALSHGYFDAYYLKAQKVRTMIRRDFDTAFGSVDCIVTPTAPTPAFTVGEKTEDPLQMYLSDILTISANLAGIPGISVPCGFTKRSLPIGLQIVAPPFHEEQLLRVAHTYERHTAWHTMRPKL